MIMWPTYRYDWELDDFDRLHRAVDRLFSDYRGESRFPALNVWTSDDAVHLAAEIPGLAPEDLHIQVEGRVLELSGERKAPEFEESDRILQQERGFGKFSRKITLPYEVAQDQVKAVYRDGVLKVTLPRSESAKPRRITVETA